MEKEITIYFEHRFERVQVSGYCPLLKCGQTRWVKGKTADGRECDIFVEYSSSNTDNFLTNHGRLCFRPFVRAALYDV